MKSGRSCFVRKVSQWRNFLENERRLLQHSKRAVYQAGIWCTSENSQQNAPNPEDWGWTKKLNNESWVPAWNTLPIASKACTELVKCNCKSQRGCTGKCACKNARWNCTELCKCQCLNSK